MAGSADACPGLIPGSIVRIVKLNPDGSRATTYHGEIVERDSGSDWITAVARWTRSSIELDGLTFAPGDTLTEYFSTTEWFNVFAVRNPDGVIRGWYCNVTLPVQVVTASDTTELIWHDLYVDLIGLPDGRYVIRDEDELHSSGMAALNPERYAAVRLAQEELTVRFTGRLTPFHDR